MAFLSIKTHDLRNYIFGFSFPVLLIHIRRFVSIGSQRRTARKKLTVRTPMHGLKPSPVRFCSRSQAQGVTSFVARWSSAICLDQMKKEEAQNGATVRKNKEQRGEKGIFSARLRRVTVCGDFLTSWQPCLARSQGMQFHTKRLRRDRTARASRARSESYKDLLDSGHVSDPA